MFTHEPLLVSECPTVRLQERGLRSGARSGPLQHPTWGLSRFPSPQLYALKREVLVPAVLGEGGERWEEGPFYFPPTELKTTPAAGPLGLLPPGNRP